MGMSMSFYCYPANLNKVDIMPIEIVYKIILLGSEINSFP